MNINFLIKENKGYVLIATDDFKHILDKNVSQINQEIISDTFGNTIHSYLIDDDETISIFINNNENVVFCGQAL